MTDPNIPQQPSHVLRVKNVGDQAFSLLQIKLPLIAGGNTGGILSTMLEHGEGVIDYLANRTVSEDANDTAHRYSLPFGHWEEVAYAEGYKSIIAEIGEEIDRLPPS